MSKALLEAAKRIGDIFDRRTYFEWIDDETGLTVKFRTREERHQFEHAIRTCCHIRQDTRRSRRQ